VTPEQVNEIWQRSPRITMLRTSEYHVDIDQWMGVVWVHVDFTKWSAAVAKRFVADSWNAQKQLGIPIVFADHFDAQGELHRKFLKLCGFVPAGFDLPVDVSLGDAHIYYRTLPSIQLPNPEK